MIYTRLKKEYRDIVLNDIDLTIKIMGVTKRSQRSIRRWAGPENSGSLCAPPVLEVISKHTDSPIESLTEKIEQTTIK